MKYVRADASHAEAVARLAALLWSQEDTAKLSAEFCETIRNESAAVFLCIEDGTEIGFAEFSIRHDYVEGTESSPVAYLEGIYVLDQYRHRGVAASLLQIGREWAKEKGCRQLASDCELDNTDSWQFHMKCGFTEANRIICFVKNL